MIDVMPPQAVAARGFSIVEVLISVTIGLFIIIGVVSIYAATSKSYTLHESESRLQEAGRYAFSILEPDVRMAGYWGLAKGAVSVAGSFSQASAAATGLTPPTPSCGTNFVFDVKTAIEGSNNSYPLTCPAFSAAAPSADTLTVRHASVTPSTIAAGTVALRICSSFVAASLVSTATDCPIEPVTVPAAGNTTANVNGGVYDLIVNSYYINQRSSTIPGLPTLYRQTFSNLTNTMVNTEILPGVEDMQVQFGIDPTGTTGVASQYVNALTATALYNASTVATAQIVAVRIWLLLRADNPEPGFTDTRIYSYADRTGAAATTLTANNAYQPADHYRRLLVTRTIMLRNAVGT